MISPTLIFLAFYTCGDSHLQFLMYAINGIRGQSEVERKYTNNLKRINAEKKNTKESPYGSSIAAIAIRF